MSKVYTRISSLSVSQVKSLSHWMAVCQAFCGGLNLFFTIFTTVKVQVVRNYINFITCQKYWSWHFYMQFRCR